MYMYRSLLYVLLPLAIAAFMIPMDAFAIGGCSRKPPTPKNPDDDGYAYCLSAKNKRCRPQCQAVNKCYNANKPPSLAGCGAQKKAFDDCINVAKSASLDGQTSLANFDLAFLAVHDGAAAAHSIAWDDQTGCYNVLSADPYVPASTSTNGALSAEECEYYVVDAVERVFGAPRGSVSSDTQLVADLGATAGDLLALTSELERHFGATVSDGVISNMVTVGDISNCIASSTGQ